MATGALYIPHGGGPMPLLGDPGHAELTRYLESFSSDGEPPSAIVVSSAHWEAATPTITASPNPDLYFDYYGFPPETYEYRYPSPGSPELAGRIADLLRDGGFAPELDSDRGLDHGAFVPLMLMHPEATIPVVQVSLVDGLDPATHIALGEALRPLLDGTVLLLGSGMSFHNMGAFSFAGDLAADADNEAFDAWLERVCASGDLDDATRRRELESWDAAPAARYNHPREEHLIPLHVCFGAGGGQGKRTFDGATLGKRVGAYQWA